MSNVKRIVVLLGFSSGILASPLIAKVSSEDTIIPDKYIVRIASGAYDIDFESHLSWVTNVHKRSLSRRSTAGVEKTFSVGDFKAYAGEFDSETIAEIEKDGYAVSVEPDRVVEATALVTQAAAPWGLSSLSSTTPLADGSSSGPYIFDSTAGEGTYAYVLDSGVTIEHAELGGRAIRGYNAWEPNYPFEDEFGHGSHVAGIIGAATYGVAKKATVVDVKVVRGLGYSTVAHVLDGYSWAVNNITNTPGRVSKAVINMSLAFPKSDAMNSAVDAAFDLGVATVVGAGNDGKDASTKSPASAQKAITVGAVAWNWTRADWSNFGADVNIFAPGLDIPSLWRQPGQVSVVSGTSMATPHVAGLVAYLQALYPLENAAAVVEKLNELAFKGVVGNSGSGSANVLAHSGVVSV
ncbi:alkaline protease [Colletotrichum costaricense]|uniref:Alkaline protease n=2 Tax=Colletotrichum acutatum species complex TaxID=2707335 RepID=A0AAJ0DU50_9PEZI|nr:alkaline protease [Colletotrichum costaricense]XP_060380633.1 alkaline protease [Colletotrichum tamarilloi]KAK1495211.1 alkaline protease [Colletotrichum tamarilloi]KAK1511288.1 alkaline protease [Colletotrichum costaricense]